MKEPHHRKKVGIGMIMVAASLALIRTASDDP